MIALTIKKVDNFVEKLQQKGVQVRWDGWDMVFFNEDKRAHHSVQGRRLGSKWGFETVVSPNAEGQWLVNYRLARGANG